MRSAANARRSQDANASTSATALKVVTVDPDTCLVTSTRTSLRSRWNRSTGVLVIIILVCGVASVIGTRMLVEAFRGSAVGVESEATAGAALKADIVTHAVVVASAISDAQQTQAHALETEIRGDFNGVEASEVTAEARHILDSARAQWEALVSATSPDVDLATRGAAVSSLVPIVLARVDEAGSATRAAVRIDLARAADVERVAVAVLALLQLLAIALAIRLARRLSTQVLRPVGILRDSANHLAAGELDHRVVVDRADELGELAVAFNAMADAIAGSQRSLTREVNTDSLSGLASRSAFEARLQTTLDGPEQRGGGQAVLFVDLDDFKDVNDTLGHAAGDELLRVVARRLSSSVRPGDFVARLGGDEFALLLEGLSDPAVAIDVAQRIVAALAQTVDIGTSHVHVGASVGLAMRNHGSTPDQLMREADVAMYAAKAKGKNRVECYDAGINDATLARNLLRADVATAVARDELVVEYQPVVDLASGAVVGLEALVRWNHPSRGLLQPASFIALAEETGAIIDIGAWVLEAAARQATVWQQHRHAPDLWVAVNVSVCQLEAPGFAENVAAVLATNRLDPANLVLEITESLLADPHGGAPAALGVIRRLGVRIALDDFGTGYSSINYLRQLPVDIIKIDRSFTVDTCSGGAGTALLEGIVAMAERLHLEVIPEGIECMEQLAGLRAMGCRIGQGFLLGRPSAADTIDALLTRPVWLSADSRRKPIRSTTARSSLTR
jgi:diguanylate cyclase (GGDEF)-like protein